jgi:hypothetical protein
MQYKLTDFDESIIEQFDYSMRCNTSSTIDTLLTAIYSFAHFILSGISQVDTVLHVIVHTWFEYAIKP